MATTLKIYGVPFSVHTRKVIVAARIKAIPYEVIPVAPVNPATCHRAGAPSARPGSSP